MQNIASDRSECWQKIDYLHEINGRINQHINYNKRRV